MVKKTVNYTPCKYDFIKVGQGAIVWPTNHPDADRVSNTAPVRTSMVLQHDEKTGEFETENTLYKPIEEEV